MQCFGFDESDCCVFYEDDKCVEECEDDSTPDEDSDYECSSSSSNSSSNGKAFLSVYNWRAGASQPGATYVRTYVRI